MGIQTWLLIVIKKSRVPETMFTSRAIMEIAWICSVPLIQAIQNIFGGMRMNYIQKNCKTIFMSHIDKSFELFWSSVATIRKVNS